MSDCHRSEQLEGKARLAVTGNTGNGNKLTPPKAQMGVQINEPGLIENWGLDLRIFTPCAEPNIAFDRTEERSPSGGVPPRQLPMRADDVASVAVRIAFQVILVLGLRLPEIASGRKLSHHLARPQP